MRSFVSSAGRHRLVRSLRLVVPLLLLVALVVNLGTDPFARSLHVLTPGPIAAAMLLGVITTAAQALRWRTVAIGYGAADGLTRSRAVQECYRSALLNAVLPGGVMGDAVRVWRQRGGRERGLRSSAQAVIGERVAGTALLLAAVSVVTLRIDLRLSGLLLGGAAVAGLIAAPTLKRLTLRGQLAVWGWSLLALASLVTKFAVAAVVLGTVPGVKESVMLALIALAGMAIPVGIGGFGPREAVTAVAFGALGLSAEAGVATAAAYGVLAAVSALPGVIVMVLDSRASLAAEKVAVEPVAVALAPVEGSQDVRPPVTVDLVALERAASDRNRAGVDRVSVDRDLVAVAQQNGRAVIELGQVLRLDDHLELSDQARLDRWLAGSRNEIDFDLLAEHEPARQSA